MLENVSKHHGMVIGVFYHLPWHYAQNIKITEGGYHYQKGLCYSSIYTWSNNLLVTSTWVE